MLLLARQAIAAIELIGENWFKSCIVSRWGWIIARSVVSLVAVILLFMMPRHPKKSPSISVSLDLEGVLNILWQGLFFTLNFIPVCIGSRYGFGFRGGRWFTLRKIQKQQQRLLNPRTPTRLSQVLRGKKAAGETPKSSKAENVSKVLEGARSA